MALKEKPMSDPTDKPRSGMRVLNRVGEGAPAVADERRAMEKMAHAQEGGQLLRPKTVLITPEMARQILAGEMPAALIADFIAQVDEGDFVFPEDLTDPEPTKH